MNRIKLFFHVSLCLAIEYGEFTISWVNTKICENLESRLPQEAETAYCFLLLDELGLTNNVAGAFYC